MRNVWILIFCMFFIWSAIAPKDYFTWLLEVAPALIGAIILGCTYNTFRLTALVYFLILLHCIILFVGGHYTYAEVPYVNWLGDIFGSHRNNYDKIGHFFQGLVPAMITREIVIRKKIIKKGAWTVFFIVSFCLAFSALYEIIEWLVALISDKAAEAFLGTQGYVWDTQSDMAIALLGAISALLILPTLHDKQMEAAGFTL